MRFTGMSDFRFKKFSVAHEGSAMKVGTDAILLGAWAIARNKILPDLVLDIGSGTGILSLMMAQAYPEAIVDAIDIEKSASEQTRKNAENSPWSERIRVYHTALQEFVSDKKYDLIISNPPFFSKGWKIENPGRRYARDTFSLSPEEIAIHAFSLLKDDGLLFLIHPPDTAKDFIAIAEKNNLYCFAQTSVFSKPNQPVKRILICATKKNKQTEISSLFIYDENGVYTKEYKKLTGEFYLEF